MTRTRNDMVRMWSGGSGRIDCKSLKTVVGPWRLERQTSTVSR